MNQSLPKFLCGSVRETPDDCQSQAPRVAGMIQSIGAILILGTDGRQVIGASDNLQNVLDFPASQALGAPLERISPQIAEEIASLVVRPGILPQVLTYTHENRGITYDVTTHVGDGYQFLEFVPNGNSSTTDVRKRMRCCSSACAGITSAANFAQASQIATDAVRAITGFDRVSIVRALSGRSDVVETESKPDAMTSYLGLHTRLNDVPVAACENRRHGSFRSIATVAHETIAVRTIPDTCARLDQTWTALRAASPLQRAYLRNRGVFATFSCALTYQGRPWGSIECQNRTETMVPIESWALLHQIASALMMKKQQEENTSAQVALRSENEALRQFAHTAAHDLRAPLRGIKMVLDWMEEDGFDNASMREHHTLASTSAAKLQTFTEGLIELSLLSEQAPDFHPVDLGDVVSDVQDLVAPELAATGGRVLAGPLPRLTGNQVLLTRLFLNLVSNALKYRHNDLPPVIDIRQTSGTSLCVAFCDNGTGIDPKHAETVFEPTKRLVHTSDVSGNGLGLAIARRIMGLHGGSIKLDQKHLQGARFVMAFPLPA